MYCPRCSQEQASDELRFCSKCGLPLTEVTGVLARGGVPAETQETKPPRSAARRWSLRLFMAALAFFVLAIFSAAAEDAAVPIFGLLTFASFVIGSCVLIYSWIKGRMRGRSQSAQLGQQTSRVEAPQRGALAPAYAPPIAMPREGVDTGKVAEPPSVTEHTTRHLEEERER
jgi:hypothetical protein